jgi:hypothetical protein
MVKRTLDNIKQQNNEQWNVRPQNDVPRPVSGSAQKVSKTLVTVSLLAWVFFLLMQ